MSIHKIEGWILVFAVMIGAAGCGSSSDSGGGAGASMDQLAGAVDAQKADRDQAAQKQKDEAAKQAAAQAAAAAQAEQQRQVAGRASVESGGYYKAIVGARRHVLNRVEDLAWTQGVQHFQATEGRLPKDHNEFMTKIIEPLGINLGFKEEDQEFLYDPSEGQWGEVYVVQKEDSATAAPAAAPAP